MRTAGEPKPVENQARLTPMMQQYVALKEQAGDAILFFRMGDFYEIFAEDAEIAAPALELVLTSREKGDQTRVPFCGVPHHAAKNYWLRLIKLGFKVAIADQVEDPKVAKGIVKREITRFITPGCIDEIEALERESPNYLVAALEDPQTNTWAVCICDVSTGELRLGQTANEEETFALIEKHQPREVLLRRFVHEEMKQHWSQKDREQRPSLSALPEAILRDQTEQDLWLKKILGTADTKKLGCGKTPGARALLAAVFVYIDSLKQPLSHFSVLQPLKEPETLMLDEIAFRDLEIFETIRRRQGEGSLFREINLCQTPMGARLLRRFLLAPLTSEKKILERQAAVRVLSIDPPLLESLRASLHSVGDLDRLLTRIMANHAHPAELHQYRTSLRQLRAISDLLKGVSLKDATLLSESVPLLQRSCRAVTLLEDALGENPGALGQGDAVFRTGFDPELDELCSLYRNGSAEVEKYENQLRAQTGINSLHIRHHKSFGLLIEVTKANLGKVPPEFVRRQTMVNNERYLTPNLENLNEKLTSAQERAVAREQSLYQHLLSQVALDKEILQAYAQALALIDVLQSFAAKALRDHYVAAQINARGDVILKGSRHPVVERFVGRDRFTANDLMITSDQKQILITGPNMGGKSTIMRQLAITAILNQIGSNIPALSGELPIFSAIFTRVGAADDLSKGQSTFLIEMIETANILRNAGPKSLVILDEVGRGTSTSDGFAIAAAVLEELILKNKCYALFATHYHELCEMAERFSGLRLMQTEVLPTEESVRFTHRLIAGSTDNSYGLEVAKLAGLTSEVLDRARLVLGNQQTPTPRSVPKAGAEAAPPSPENPLGLKDFSGNRLQKISDRLRKLKIQRTTPLQALNILSDLKLLLDHEESPTLFD